MSASDVESVMDEFRRGLISAAEANVQMVRCEGVRLIAGRVGRDVRAALNAAVREGRLGHLKKDGLKPEAYFHPNSEANARDQRNQKQARAYAAIARISGSAQ